MAIFADKMGDRLKERPPRGSGRSRGKKLAAGTLRRQEKLTERLKTQALLARQRRQLLGELRKLEGVYDPSTGTYDLVKALRAGVEHERLAAAFNRGNILAAQRLVAKEQSVGPGPGDELDQEQRQGQQRKRLRRGPPARPLQHQAAPFMDSAAAMIRNREVEMSEFG